MTTDLRIGHLAGIVAVLAAVPVLALGGAAAQAAGGGITVFPGINQPNDITTGPDAALWFTDYGNNSIGRITTTGKITTYTGGGINGPDDITAGPDGALWFTNYGGNSFGSPSGNSIGRITTTGKITTYTSAGVVSPYAITAGPGGTLWFTCLADSIGQITTAAAPHPGAAGTTVTTTK